MSILFIINRLFHVLGNAFNFFFLVLEDYSSLSKQSKPLFFGISTSDYPKTNLSSMLDQQFKLFYLILSKIEINLSKIYILYRPMTKIESAMFLIYLARTKNEFINFHHVQISILKKQTHKSQHLTIINYCKETILW